MRIFKSHPLLKLVNSYVIDSPQPSNLSYLWNFGSLLGFCLVIQIVTGVTLAMHYNPSVLEAFNSVEHIMRDVNNGWLIRYLHSNTASAFFFLVISVLSYCFSLDIFNINLAVTIMPLYANNSSLSKLEEEYSSPEGKHDYLPPLHKLAQGNVGDKVGHTSNPKIPLDSLSDEDFFEWLRGFVDAEGNFFIQIVDNRFKFIFTLCLHKDETPLIKYIRQRLGHGNISIRDKSVNYTLSSKGDLQEIFSIFDIRPLNTSKNLNYILFRQAYDLYFNRESLKVTMELRKVIINLKDQMNKKRIDFNQPKGHSINITHYWFLGFTEGDGYFSVNSQDYGVPPSGEAGGDPRCPKGGPAKPAPLLDYSLRFGIGQTASEIAVMEAIQRFLYGLPGKYSIKRNNTNLVKLATYNAAKDRDHERMAYITVNQTDFIMNVILPFFDSLIWLSKKEQDYQDWKLILNIINQGKHFTGEGKELISLIAKTMNNNRLTTNLALTGEPLDSSSFMEVKERALKLLSSPSNYELQPDGKILIKSLGTYFKGRGNVGVRVLDEEGELIYSFNSIKDCALFFNVHSRTINRRLDNGSFVEFNGKNLVFKREVLLP